MTKLLANPVLISVGLVIIHTIWEVTLLGLLTWSSLFLLQGHSAATRYRVACAGLGAMVAAPILTLACLVVLGLAPAAFAAESVAWAFPAIRDGAAGVTALAMIRAALPWLALLWAAGASLMGLRTLGGLWWLERALVAPARPAAKEWQAKVDALATRMGIQRRIHLRESGRADSPLVIGWLRPVILVPAAAFLHLTPETLTAVLAHELAHIRRHDYLINLLQAFAEALLFFHPAAWWLSRQIRELREHCCDDLAAAVCGSALDLAEGLSALEALRRTLAPNPAPELALGAAQGDLMTRITRLFQPQTRTLPSARGLVFSVGTAFLIGAATLAAQATANPAQPTAASTGVKEVAFKRIKVLDQPAPPAYPAEAKALRISGIVVVGVTIDEQGLPEQVDVLSGPEELRATAIDYAKDWKFAPVKVKGKAVKARFNLTMPFKLK